MRSTPSFSKRFARFTLLAFALAPAACSSDAERPAKGGDTPDASAGGSPGSGGSSASGGGGAAGQAGGGTGGAGAVDSGADPGIPVEVTTSNGALRGSLSGGVNAFLGIPFAASTGGANRWKVPQPVTAWSGVRDATEYGPICPQHTAGSTNYDPTSDEDCLSVNVWTPNLTPSAPLPVMVWIYGGAFVFGSGGGAYEGAYLAAHHDVVVVTLNYRLGALGFLAHPALTAEDPANPSGAYGIADQIAALQWVKDNVATFGGDPQKVTLFGESAGGRSVCWHLLSPKSRGLFQGAIVESGLCMAQTDTLAVAEGVGERYATAKGCTDPTQAASCLRALEPTVLAGGPGSPLPGGLFFQNKADVFFFQPIVDGVILPDQLDTLFADPTKIANVPVLHGATTAEGTLFSVGIFQDTPPANETEYRDAIARRFGTRTDEIVAKYPVASFPTPGEALSEVTGDAFFVCAARRMARLLSAAGITNYLYSFDGKIDPPLIPALANKAFHSAEIPYVFGNTYILGPAASPALADSVQGYWTRFVKTGDPNGAPATVWPAYTTAADPHLTLGSPIAAGAALKKDNCDFWDTIPVPP